MNLNLLHFMFRNPVNHPSVMMRRSDIISCGGYSHLPFLEDYLLWLRLVNCGGKIVNIPFPLTVLNVVGRDKRRTGKMALHSEMNLMLAKLTIFPFCYYPLVIVSFAVRYLALSFSFLTTQFYYYSRGKL